MNQKTILRYLSTTSDTFLVVGFTSLLALPIALALVTQPVLREETPKYTTSRVQTTPNVLGVTDVATPALVNPLQNVAVKFNPSVGGKIAFDSYSSTTGEYSVAGSFKAAGTYDIMTLTNNNSTVITVNPALLITDTKTTTYTFMVGTESHPVVKNDTDVLPVITLQPNSQTVLSVKADSKNLGSFKLTAKLS